MFSNPSSQWLIVPTFSIFSIVFWMTINLIDFFDWNQGLGRGLVTLIVNLVLMALLFLGQTRNLLVAKILTTVNIVIATMLTIYYTIFFPSKSHDFEIVQNGIAFSLSLITTLVFLRSWLLKQEIGNQIYTRIHLSLVFLCALFFAFNVPAIVQGLREPMIIDVGETTLESAKAILSGQNPYTLLLDESNENIPNLSEYTGFKYMPLMAITFMPFSRINEGGIILSNLILYILVAIMIYLISDQITSSHTFSLFSLFLYLLTPLIPNEVFRAGVTDLAPVLYMLLGIFFLRSNSFLSGLFIGFSVSTKLLPGILLIPLYLPPRNRFSYFLGLFGGIIPIIYFLCKSPEEFIRNAFVFNLIRPTDTTSWLHYYSDQIGFIVKIIAIAIFVSISIYSLLRKPSLVIRCELTIISILFILLTSPINHRNYQIWWIPLLCIVSSAIALRYIEIIDYFDEA